MNEIIFFIKEVCMKIQNSKYVELQKNLEKAVLKDKEQLNKVLFYNKDLINEIVIELGSGSIFLVKPYNDLCKKSDYEHASNYQILLENINEMALLGEDS
jgi:hypothetical protein